MNYFDFLGLTGMKDTREAFKQFLIDFMERTEEQAERESKIYYQDEK